MFNVTTIKEKKLCQNSDSSFASYIILVLLKSYQVENEIHIPSLLKNRWYTYL